MTSIADHIGLLTSTAVDIVVGFATALTTNDNVTKMVNAGFTLIVEFIKGLANAISGQGQELIDAGTALGAAIAGAIGGALSNGLSKAWDNAKGTLEGLIPGDPFGVNNPKTKHKPKPTATTPPPILAPAAPLPPGSISRHDLSGSLQALTSFNQATEISNANAATQSQGATGPTMTSETSITLIQNNTSPKALSTAEIYRQTNNQLSIAKGALAG